jgi:hypothetical protein
LWVWRGLGMVCVMPEGVSRLWRCVWGCGVGGGRVWSS